MCQPPPVSLSAFLGNLTRQLQALPLRVLAASELVTHRKANTDVADGEDGALAQDCAEEVRRQRGRRLLLSREHTQKLQKHRAGLDPGDRESESKLFRLTRAGTQPELRQLEV